MYDEGAIRLDCPIDGSPMNVIGSSDYQYRCQQNSHQFKVSGNLLLLGPPNQVLAFVAIAPSPYTGTSTNLVLK